MEELRKATPPKFTIDVIQGENLTHYANLLNTCFNVKDGQFLEDFPVWDPTKNNNLLRVGIYEGKQLVAGACVRVARMKINRTLVEVAVIGGVVCNEGNRGEGLASRAVLFACEWAIQNGAAAVFLWGSEYEMYNRLGFELCGLQVRRMIKDMNLPEVGELKVNQGWNDRLLALVRKRPGGFQLTKSDEDWFKAHRNVKWFWIEQNGEPVAYAGYGRGIDLPGIVHEWGGEQESVSRLLRYIANQHSVAQLIGSPDLFEKFNFSYESSQIEFVTQCAMVRPERFLAAAYPDISAEVTVDEDGLWDVEFSGMKHSKLNAHQMTRFLFGPGSVIPVPIWIWGLDAG